MLNKLGLYWRTLVHLKPLQILFRLNLLFRKRVLGGLRTLTEWWYTHRMASADYQTVNRLEFGPAEIHYLLGRDDRLAVDTPEGMHTFSFLNKTIMFRDRVDWQPDRTTLLWRYNLHYFEYAYDLGVAYSKLGHGGIYTRFQSLVTDWCANNPIAGTIGWDSYPTSLRIVNWIKAYHLFEVALNQDTVFRSLLLEALYKQALFLENNVEYHLLNNHVIENGRALLLAGLFFEDKNARQWREKGIEILWRELRHQIADDGGQFELSPMYHAAALLAYAEVATVLRGCRLDVPSWADETIKQMARYLALMCHPDGEIAFLNDAALGMTPPAQQVLKAVFLMGYGDDPEVPQPNNSFTPLSASGFYLVRDKAYQSFLVFDCGTLGPDYQPGHGHCDVLSYEWSFYGERVVVDSGVDDYYRQDVWRAYYRGTRAHNTVMVDGQEQSEIWGNFRVGRRAHPLPVEWHIDEHIVSIQGGHDGYQHLPGEVMHCRDIAVIDGSNLVVLDQILGGGEHRVESFVHFHPRFELITQEADQNVLVIGPSTRFALLPFGPDIIVETCRGQEEPLQGWYAPEFGKRFGNGVVSLSWRGKLPLHFGYCLVPLVDEEGGETVSLTWRTLADAYKIELRTARADWIIARSQEGVLHASYG